MDPDSTGIVGTGPDQSYPDAEPHSAGRRRGPLERLLRLAGLVAAIAAGVIVILLVLAVVNLLPKSLNPFGERTTVRSSPVVLKSINALSRYEAASGSFQVIVNLQRRTSWLPTFIEGSQTLFVGDGTDIAFVDFSRLKGSAITMSHKRTWVMITAPPAQLEPASLNVQRSYVFAQQQGLLNRIASFFSGNPDSQHQVYVLAQKKIQAAAKHSALLIQAQHNTRAMLTSLMRSLGFSHVVVSFRPG